jgi:hypothetical protein
MDLTTIVDALSWIMTILSAGFLAYGGWLCFYHLTADRVQPRTDKASARPDSRYALTLD